MLKTIDDNDTSVKMELKSEFDTLEEIVTKLSTEVINGINTARSVSGVGIKSLEDNVPTELDTIKGMLNMQTSRLIQMGQTTE